MDSKDKYGVFIIESLTLKNEIKGDIDGQILKDILDLCRIPNDYYYIRTRKELKEIILEFRKSDLRYLHFSCHANEHNVSLTFDNLTYNQFSKIVSKELNNKRLFISACEASNFDFAKEIIPSSGCTSVIGSPNKINFDKSAVFWAGFYHLMNEQDSQRMGQPEKKKNIQNLVDSFNIPINYYSFIRNNKKELRENLLRPNKTLESRKIKINQNIVKG